MMPLEDWRVNRGMTGSFLCWKFEGKKAVLLKQTFLMEGTLFQPDFTGPEAVRLPTAKAEFLHADFGFRTSATLLR